LGGLSRPGRCGDLCTGIFREFLRGWLWAWHVYGCVSSGAWLEELVRRWAARSRLPALWSRSLFVATVGVGSAGVVWRYIGARYERVLRRGDV
jgi:hypothetical protein